MFSKSKGNLLDLVPRPKVEHQEREDGLVILLVPRFQSRWALRLFGSWSKNPLVSFRLDELGSFVWKHMDGVRTIEQLAGELSSHRGLEVAPLLERVAFFVRTLERNGFVDLS